MSQYGVYTQIKEGLEVDEKSEQANDSERPEYSL